MQELAEASTLTTQRRRRWRQAFGCFMASLVLVGGVVVYFAHRSPESPSAAPAHQAPTDTSTLSPLAEGCLGGTDPAKAILEAREEAPLTPEGAAAFTATLMRWLGQAPRDAAQFKLVQEQIWDPSLLRQGAQVPSPPPSTTSWLSTRDGRYRVVEVSGDEVTIESVFTQTVSEGSATTDVQQVGQLTLTSASGHWALKAVGPASVQPQAAIAGLVSHGRSFEGGC